MPYHAQVIGLEWSGLTPQLQAFILGVIKVMGAANLACGAMLLCLVAPLLRGQRWAAYAVLSNAAFLWAPTLYVAISLRSVAPSAQTPVLPVAGMLTVLVVDGCLQLIGSRGGRVGKPATQAV